jgi:hypothetical protein
MRRCIPPDLTAVVSILVLATVSANSGRSLLNIYPGGQTSVYSAAAEAAYVSLGGIAIVRLGKAGDFAVMACTGISTVLPTKITGDIGVSPIAGTAITGFAMAADVSGTFWKTTDSALVTGKIYAANYAVPTPAMMTTAVGDMRTAYTDASSRLPYAPFESLFNGIEPNPSTIELRAGIIDNIVFTVGVYKWSSVVVMNADITITGSSTDIFVFQIAQTLTVAADVKMILKGGVLSKNIFWSVAGVVSAGARAQLHGVFLAATAVTFVTGANLQGRILAQTFVTLGSATITEPSTLPIACAASDAVLETYSVDATKFSSVYNNWYTDAAIGNYYGWLARILPDENQVSSHL